MTQQTSEILARLAAIDAGIADIEAPNTRWLISTVLALVEERDRFEKLNQGFGAVFETEHFGATQIAIAEAKQQKAEAELARVKSDAEALRQERDRQLEIIRELQK